MMRFTLFLFIALNSFELFAQNTSIRLVSEGPPPEYFLINSRDKTKETEIVTSPYRPRNERIAEIEFYKSSNYWVNDLLGSGKVVYGEKIHAYLNKILNKITEANGITDKIYVHPVKYGYFNAFATDIGLIFINVGLLAKVRNEAELAFILCHELVHYHKKHNLDGHLNAYKIENLKEYSGQNTYDKVVSKHSYSRKLESEADSLGYLFYIKSGYAPEAAVSVFDLMINDQIFDDGVDLNQVLDFKSLYSSLSSDVIDSLEKYIMADTIEQEELRTHPDSRKRKYKMELNNKNQNEKGKLFLVSESEFNEMKNLACLEESRLARIENNFFDAFYFGMYNYQKGNGPKEVAAVSILHSLVGMLQLKVFDPIVNPRYKNYGGLSNANLNEQSSFREMAFYFAGNDYQKLIDDISSVFGKFQSDFPESIEMKILKNWFIEFLEREVKPQNASLNITLEKTKIESKKIANARKIYLDPSFFSLDFRKVYMLDYKRTEKENIKVIEKMNKLNKTDKYAVYSVANRNNVTTSVLNNLDLIQARMDEISNYPKEAKIYSTDYSELQLFCENNKTELLSTSGAVTAYIKRPSPIGAILCFYSVVLSPIGIYLMITPVHYTYLEYVEYNLISGQKITTKEVEQESSLSGGIFNDMFFPKN